MRTSFRMDRSVAGVARRLTTSQSRATIKTPRVLAAEVANAVEGARCSPATADAAHAKEWMMPLDPNKEYQAADAVEILFPRDADGNEVAYRRWTGDVQISLKGYSYTTADPPELVEGMKNFDPGGILDIG